MKFKDFLDVLDPYNKYSTKGGISMKKPFELYKTKDCHSKEDCEHPHSKYNEYEIWKIYEYGTCLGDQEIMIILKDKAGDFE